MPLADVLRVITRLNIGGPARQALLLTKKLRPEYRTVLVAGSPEEREGELEDADVPVERVPLRRPLSPARDVAAYRAVSGLVRRSNPKIVHTHMAKAGAIGRLAAFRAPSRPITVHTYHGHVLEGYFRRPVERTFIAIERMLAKRTDALVAVSDHVRDELLALGIGVPSRFHVIPLGFDLTRFLEVDGRTGAIRNRLGLKDDTPLVAVIGRLAPIKDHETLFRALARLDGVHLAVLGDGELRQRLQDTARDLQVAERVHFVGWVDDVASAIADMDVVVLTSRNEGTPVSLIEAGACGRPAVSTDVGGVGSVIRDDETGLLVQAGDEGGVALALNKVLSDRALAQRLGTAARRHVRERFDQERLISDVRDLYLEVARRRESGMRKGARGP